MSTDSWHQSIASPQEGGVWHVSFFSSLVYYNRRTPLCHFVFQVHEYLRSKLCSLYENDCIFDKFECCWNGNDRWAPTLNPLPRSKDFFMDKCYSDTTKCGSSSHPPRFKFAQHMQTFCVDLYLRRATPALSIHVVICSGQRVGLRMIGSAVAAHARSISVLPFTSVCIKPPAVCYQWEFYVWDMGQYSDIHQQKLTSLWGAAPLSCPGAPTN